MIALNEGYLLTVQQAGALGGKKRWAKIKDRKLRSLIMKKVRKGSVKSSGKMK